MNLSELLGVCREDPEGMGVALLFSRIKLPEEGFDCKGHDASQFDCSHTVHAAYNKNARPIEQKGLVREAIQHLICNPSKAHAFVAGTVHCESCGQRVPVYFDGESLEIRDECHNDPKNLAVEVAIPSGRLLCGNDFRSVFPKVSHSVNQLAGLYSTTRDYAKHGMFFPYTGDACGGIAQISDTRIEIGHTESNLSICTDLFWLSFSDEVTLQKWAEATGKDWEEFLAKKVEFSLDIKPGIYRCSYELPTEDYDAAKCIIEWVRDMGPSDVIDFRADKEFADTDHYQQFLHGKTAGKFRTFGSYVKIMSHIGYEGGDWFEGASSAEKLAKALKKRYPKINEFPLDEILCRMPKLDEKIEFCVESTELDGEHAGRKTRMLMCEAYRVLENIPYAADYTVWSSVLMCISSALLRGDIDAEFQSAARETASLCVINLQERGLFEQGLAWIDATYPLVDDRNHPIVTNVRRERLETLRPLYESVHPGVEFDLIREHLSMYQ